MIDSKTREAYKSVKAPEDLRQRVMELEDTAKVDNKKFSPVWIKPLISFAACMTVCFLTIGIVSQKDGKTVKNVSPEINSYKAELLSDSAKLIVISDATEYVRSIGKSAISCEEDDVAAYLNIAVNEPVSLSCTKGTLYVMDREYGQYITADDQITKNSDLILIVPEEDSEIDITVTSEKDKQVYTLVRKGDIWNLMNTK